MSRLTNTASEKVIEDILSTDKSILADLLSLSSSDLSLFARQKALPSGKLDLLYLHKDELLLIELKVVPFYNEIIKQINGYESDLIDLQSQSKLINAKLKKVILVTSATPSNSQKCQNENCFLVEFKVEDILTKYYENFKEVSTFLTIQSGDYGVVRLGLLIRTLFLISEGNPIKGVSNLESKSQKTIQNRLSVARQLNLVTKIKTSYYLTELGNAFIGKQNQCTNDRLNEEQITILSNFINQNPFYSSLTYTIFSLIESVFILSKSQYPVPFDKLVDYFVNLVGKSSTWKKPKARETATYIFSNYASELEFIVKVNNEFFISPKGIQAILLLQLNRSIKLIESKY